MHSCGCAGVCVCVIFICMYVVKVHGEWWKYHIKIYCFFVLIDLKLSFFIIIIVIVVERWGPWLSLQRQCFIFISVAFILLIPNIPYHIYAHECGLFSLFLYEAKKTSSSSSTSVLLSLSHYSSRLSSLLISSIILFYHLCCLLHFCCALSLVKRKTSFEIDYFSPTFAPISFQAWIFHFGKREH